jgi:hypothetical protein
MGNRASASVRRDPRRIRRIVIAGPWSRSPDRSLVIAVAMSGIRFPTFCP